MQAPIDFFRDLRALRTPSDAPAKVVRQCASARMAMRVSLRATRCKQRTVAQAIHKSDGYLSKIVNGHEPMPEWFPAAFCQITGSNLLRQFLALQDALADAADTEAWQERRMADDLRRAAA